MARDLKKILREENYHNQEQKMSQGHEDRFLSKLEEALPEKKKTSRFLVLKIAATVLIILGAVWALQPNKKVEIEPTVVEQTDKEPIQDPIEKSLSLGSLSPDLKKIEDYYMASINLELAGLPLTGDNKQLIDGYLKQLLVLDTEYKKLNEELNNLGPNEETVTALIKNLQLRLQLLLKLKNKLEVLKSSKNEQVTSEII